MRVVVRSLAGEAVELDPEPSTTIAQLKAMIEAAMGVRAAEQRLIYAGVQLEECASPAWRARFANAGEVSIALGLASMPDGTPLTLEHHGLQKGSVVNIVRHAAAPGALAAAAAAAPVSAAAMAAASAARPDGAAPAPARTEPYAAAPAASGERAAAQGPPSSGLAEGLMACSDLELLMLLRPVMRQRPALLAALLADDPSLPDAAAAPAAAPRTARAAAAFGLGSAVTVWSNSANRWFLGEVVAVAESSHDRIPQGSVEVSFELGRKWVAPADLGRFLRPAS